MTRSKHDAHFTAIHVAQEARRADHANLDFADVPIVQPTQRAIVHDFVAPVFVRLCVAADLPAPIAEFRFAPPRKWRFDWAWPVQKLAFEIEGGIWNSGRHTRGAGALADLEKYSEAAILGWRIVYATPADYRTTGIERIRRALA